MIDEIQQHLEYARALCDSRCEYGVDGIREFVSDVDGDWLRTWGDDDMLIHSVDVIYYEFDKQLVITTNLEDVVITVSNVNKEQAEYLVEDLTEKEKWEMKVIPLRKDGYRLSEFGLGK